MALAVAVTAAQEPANGQRRIPWRGSAGGYRVQAT
jgi:hypothetical protein